MGTSGPFVCTSGAAAPITFFITLGGILDLRTFPRPGSSEALSIGPGSAARDSRAAAIDRRRDLLDMSNFHIPGASSSSLTDYRNYHRLQFLQCFHIPCFRSDFQLAHHARSARTLLAERLATKLWLLDMEHEPGAHPGKLWIAMHMERTGK